MNYTIDEMVFINIGLEELIKKYTFLRNNVIDKYIRDDYDKDIRFLRKLLEKNYEQYEL